MNTTHEREAYRRQIHLADERRRYAAALMHMALQADADGRSDAADALYRRSAEFDAADVIGDAR